LGTVINAAAAGLGAATGFLLGGAAELYHQWDEPELDWDKKVLAKATGGAVGGAVTGLTMGGSLVLEAGATLAGGFYGGMVTRGLSGEEVLNPDAIVDDASGSLKGMLIGKTLKVIGQATKTQVQARLRPSEPSTANSPSNSSPSPPPRVVAAEETVRVGRWMSQAEADAMAASGRVQAPFNGAGATHVTVPPNPAAFAPPASSSTFVEFNVPSSQLRIHDPGQGWGRVFGPDSIEARLAARKGLPVPTQMPTATQIQPTASAWPRRQ